jgi:glycosyltransferase involved in cell wall biosynthesis
LRSLLRDLDPDIIHSWLFEMSFLAAASRWPSRTPPLIVSRRNLVEWFARQSIYYPLARWTNRQADILLANSEAVRADVMRKERVGGERIALIYNGVDTDRFHPRERDAGFASALGLPADVPVIGVVANLHLYKGHLDLLDAAARLRVQGFRFVLLFVGREGPASEPVRARAAELDVPAIWAGPRNDVERLLPLMDVVVSASHEEGFSNSILEAMASGRAIVATAVGGTPEQIVDGQTGRLVPRRDPASLAAALKALLDDPALRGRLGQAARQTAEQKFSLHRLHEEMERLYRDLAN